MEYNAITKTCTDVGIRACCLLVLVLYFMFEIKYLELMLAMFSPNQIKKKDFLPENTMLQSSAIKASSS